MTLNDALVDEVRPGTILAERYRVERHLGAGGMGIVVAARHVSLGYPVAIKYLHNAAAKDKEAMQRFMREAWAASQIKSSHAVRVSDVASLPSGAPFIVMEYLEGEDLAQLLERRMSLPPSEAVGLILQVCESIAEAHALGIVHRDLKPSNIFCVRGAAGRVHAKVLDFGISKFMNGEISGLSITTTRTALGSPLYMSPEQMHSAKVVDARSDIWSLGVIFYELVTGVRPFEATSLPELAIRVATEAPRPPRELCPSLPRGLERIILRCLEKDRTRRHANVNAFVDALSAFELESPRVRRATPAAKAQLEEKRAEGRRLPRLRRPAVVLALIASAAIGALGYVLASSPATPAASPPALRPRAASAPALVEHPPSSIEVETAHAKEPPVVSGPSPAALDHGQAEPSPPISIVKPAPRRVASKDRTTPKPQPIAATLPPAAPQPSPPPVVAEVQPVQAEAPKTEEDSTPETNEFGGRE